MTAGTIHVECPECHEAMPALVTCQVVTDEYGEQSLACKPDMTDIWAHMWSHDG